MLIRVSAASFPCLNPGQILTKAGFELYPELTEGRGDVNAVEIHGAS